MKKNLTQSDTTFVKIPYALLILSFFSLISTNIYASLLAEVQSMQAAVPSIQSCSAAGGFDLISGDISTGQADIQGALPYVRSYQGVVRANLSAINDLYDPMITTGGWTDNYTSYLRRITATDGTGELFVVRLPGETHDVAFYVDYTIPSAPVIDRLYTSSYLYSTVNNAPVKYSTDLGEYQLVLTNSTTPATRTVLQVKRYNQTYTFGSLRFAQNNGSGYARVTQSFNPATRTMLTYSYDTEQNLTQVADNRNNVLVFTHTYKTNPSGTQTVADRRAITSVTLKSGVTPQGTLDQQSVQYNYRTVSMTDLNGNSYTTPQLIKATTPRYGFQTYSYIDVMQPALNAFRYSSTGVVSNFTAPLLNEVRDANNQVSRHWDVTVSYTGGSWNGTAKIRSYVPLSSSYLQDMTAIFPDSSGATTTSLSGTVNFSYNQRRTSDGASTASYTFQTLSQNTNSYGYWDWDDSVGTITMNTGSMPCLQVSGRPIQQVTLDSWRSHLTSVTDGKGTTTNYLYDTLNRIQQVTEAAGTSLQRITSYAYQGILATPITVTAPLQTIQNALNSFGQVLTQTRTSSLTGSQTKVYTYTYNETAGPSYGLLATARGPRQTNTSGPMASTNVVGSINNDTHSYLYDNYGNMSVDAYSVNGVSRNRQLLQINSAGLAYIDIAANRVATQIDYDTGYRPLKITVGTQSAGLSVTGRATSTTYNTLGLPLTSTDTAGLVTSYGYDGANRLTTVTHPNGKIDARTYYLNGDIATQYTLDDTGIASMYVRVLDTFGRLLREQQSSDTTRDWVQYTYDANNNIITIAKLAPSDTATVIASTRSYDVLNRLTAVKDFNGQTETLTIDSADNVTNHRYSNNSGSGFGYRDHHVQSIENSSDVGSFSHVTDLDDNVTQTTHLTRLCNYGPYNEIGVSDGTNCTVSSGTADSRYVIDDRYTYDSVRFNQLTKATSNGNLRTTRYGYDSYDAVTSKTEEGWTATSDFVQRTVQYGYDAAGRQTSLTLPSGKQLSYNYLSNGDLSGINLNGVALISALSYNSADQVTGWKWGSSQNQFNMSYTPQGRLSTLTNTRDTGSVLYRLDYAYYLNGQLKSQSINSAAATTYSYDNLGQLTSEVASSYSTSFGYDSNGNRTSLSASGTGNPYGVTSTASTFTAGTNRLASLTWGTVALSMSHATTGELITIGGLYPVGSYDYLGRRSVENAFGSSPARRIEYNYKDERILRTGGITGSDRHYVYDEDSHLIGEYQLNGTPVVEYVWLGDRPIAAIQANGAITYLVTDHQGKPRRGYDSVSWAQVWSWDPDAFGVKAAVTTTGVVMNLRFPGQVFDELSGLYYNHHRYYAPKLGRYMESDPAGLGGGNNTYAYAGNDPVNNIDPSGLDFEALTDLSLGLSTYAGSLPTIPDRLYNFSMGTANGVSFGLAQPISNWVNGYETANKSNTTYKTMEYGSLFLGPGGLVRGGEKLAANGAEKLATNAVAKGAKAPNMSPPGAGRSGALNEAKRQSGVPTSQQPSRTLLNTDKRGNPQPGRIYEYEVPAPGGGTRTMRIRDDAGGHNYGPGNPQNRGPHFNDEAKNHYDY